MLVIGPQDCTQTVDLLTTYWQQAEGLDDEGNGSSYLIPVRDTQATHPSLIRWLPKTNTRLWSRDQPPESPVPAGSTAYCVLHNDILAIHTCPLSKHVCYRICQRAQMICRLTQSNEMCVCGCVECFYCLFLFHFCRYFGDISLLLTFSDDEFPDTWPKRTNTQQLIKHLKVLLVCCQILHCAGISAVKMEISSFFQYILAICSGKIVKKSLVKSFDCSLEPI